MTQQVNLDIVDGEPFFSHETSVNFTPTQFTMDFKCITPRVDPRSKKATFQLKHNVVMLDPFQAKALLSVMATSMEKYEKEFGKVKKPAAMAKAEKKQQAAIKKAGKAKEPKSSPNYMG